MLIFGDKNASSNPSTVFVKQDYFYAEIVCKSLNDNLSINLNANLALPRLFIRCTKNCIHLVTNWLNNENLLLLYWKHMERSMKTYDWGKYRKSEWYQCCLSYIRDCKQYWKSFRIPQQQPLTLERPHKVSAWDFSDLAVCISHRQILIVFLINRYRLAN